MDLQQNQLDRLGSWLTQMETRIKDHGPIGSDLDTIQKQVETHKTLQTELESEQAQVHGLQNMVVVVDEASADSNYLQLEQQLESLGSRWAAVCRWVEDQWQVLQEVLTKWRHFLAEQKQFDSWLKEKESVLCRMRKDNMSDVNEVIEQVRQLKVSFPNLLPFPSLEIPSPLSLSLSLFCH